MEEEDGTRKAWGGLKIRADPGSNADQGSGKGPQSANNCPVDVRGCKLHITVAPTLRDVDSLRKPDVGTSHVDSRSDPSLGFHCVVLEGQRKIKICKECEKSETIYSVS